MKDKPESCAECRFYPGNMGDVCLESKLRMTRDGSYTASPTWAASCEYFKPKQKYVDPLTGSMTVDFDNGLRIKYGRLLTVDEYAELINNPWDMFNEPAPQWRDDWF